MRGLRKRRGRMRLSNHAQNAIPRPIMSQTSAFFFKWSWHTRVYYTYAILVSDMAEYVKEYTYAILMLYVCTHARAHTSISMLVPTPWTLNSFVFQTRCWRRSLDSLCVRVKRRTRDLTSATLTSPCNARVCTCILLQWISSASHALLLWNVFFARSLAIESLLDTCSCLRVKRRAREPTWPALLRPCNALNLHVSIAISYRCIPVKDATNCVNKGMKCAGHILYILCTHTLWPAAYLCMALYVCMSSDL